MPHQADAWFYSLPHSSASMADHLPFSVSTGISELDSLLSDIAPFSFEWEYPQTKERCLVLFFVRANI